MAKIYFSNHSHCLLLLITQCGFVICSLYRIETLAMPFNFQPTIFSVKMQYNRPCKYSRPWLNRLTKNKNIAISADKEPCTVILNKTDYVNKVIAMISEGISKGTYVKTVDSTHKDLKHFQDFLYRHFCKTKYYDGMRPVSNQPAPLKRINLILLKILMLKIWNLDLL